MPGKSVLIPPSPEEPEKEGAGGKDVAGAAKKHLSRRGWVAGETGDLEPTEHHTGRGAAKYGEQGEILQIDDGECEAIHRGG